MLRSTSFILLVIIGLAVTPGQRVSTQAPAWATKQIKKQMPAYKDGGVLREVRAASHSGYDSVVFEFNGDVVPSYTITYKRPPFYMGESDQRVSVAGRAFLQVSFTPAVAHDIDTNQVTVKSPDGLLNLTVLKEAKSIYDQGGYVEYVLGLSSSKPFRAQALTNPARLVVDIKH